MCAARTIEDYVDEIIGNISEAEYDSLDEIGDTLRRMKYSSKTKHMLNYWRVMQCLGEIAVDSIINHLISIDKTSCKCHLYFNMNCVMRLFVDVMCSVVVIKRVIHHKNKLSQILFKAIRQGEEDTLVSLGFEAMLRWLTVGKGEVAEVFVKQGILKDLHQHIKYQSEHDLFSYNAIEVVLTSSNLLLLIAQCGTEDIIWNIRRSAAMRALAEYVAKLGKNKVTKLGVTKIGDNFTDLRDILLSDRSFKSLTCSWKSKSKLQEVLEQDTVFQFCSSPNCRKIYSESLKFRYCGACKLARYCSEACQKDHWKLGHKESCLHQPPDMDN